MTDTFKDTYQNINAATIDTWCQNGWQWGQPISHDVYEKALLGEWDVFLTPTKAVPHSWFLTCENNTSDAATLLKDKKILGLASGGGQQIPVFSALGAACTVLDYSSKQCISEKLVADREGYQVEILQEDMTKPLPFEDETFDIIFHPVSNVYVEKVEPIFKECYRVLKKGGILLGGYEIGINFVFDDNEDRIMYSLPFNPLKNQKLYEESMKNDWGIQFSHTLEEQIGGQLRAGFRITDLYEDTNGSGNLHEHNIPSFIAVRSIKEL